MTNNDDGILGNSIEKNGKNYSFFIILIIAFSVVVLLTFTQNGGNNNNINSVKIEGNEGKIKITDIDTKAKFYNYEVENVKIKFFAVEGSDGNVHVAFDACDVCYEAKKGYSQSDLLMQCNNCGQTFAINSIGTENLEGGCWPSYLPMISDEDYVIMKISDLEKGKFMFE